jgi:hypothetical protein
MAVLINASIRVDKITKSKINKGFLDVTIAINDKVDNYGQNVAITESLSKEERESGAKKNYIGNGNVVWKNDNPVEVIKKQKKQDESQDEEIPF